MATQSSQPISHLTLGELQALIADEVALQLEIHKQMPEPSQAEEALSWLRAHRWTPPPGSPTTLEMIREDRDR